MNNSVDGGHQMTHTSGGAIAAYSSNMTFQGLNTLNFIGNICKAELCGGGAMYVESFYDNYANYHGRGMLIERGNVHITGTMLFTNNFARFDGGGMHMEDSNMDIAGAVSLTYNTCRINDGGMYLSESSIRFNRSDSINVKRFMTLENDADDSRLFSHSKAFPAMYFNRNIALLGGAIFNNDISDIMYCASFSLQIYKRMLLSTTV